MFFKSPINDKIKMNFLSAIIWDISPEIFTLGSFSVRWYGFLFALSFITGYQILHRIFIRENKSPKDLDNLSIYIILGTVIGARLGHCLFYSPIYYLSHPIEILQIWEGGLASHGGAIGILIAAWIFSKKNKQIGYLWILDRLVIVVALAGFFIRLGNFFNSEIYGIPTDVPWAVIFALKDNLPRHPTQIYEALAYLISFFILFFIYKKTSYKSHSGLLLGIFLVLIFSIRFLLEFLKEVQSSFEVALPLDMGQLLSIPFIIAGVVLIIRTQHAALR